MREVTVTGATGYNTAKPWYQYTLSRGVPWTVPAGVTVATITACAAGGPSGGGGVAGTAVCSMSVSAPSSSLVSGTIIGSDLLCYQTTTGSFNSFNSPVYYINPDRTAMRISSNNSAGAAFTYGCSDKTTVNGTTYAITAGYYNNVIYVVSTPDAGITVNTTNTSYNTPTTILDIIVDPTGVNPGFVIAFNGGGTPSVSAWADPTLAITSHTDTTLSFTSNNLKGGRYLNGNFVCFGVLSTYPQIAYTATATGSWTALQIDGVNASTIYDMAYSPSLGMYIAVCSTGAVYTASAIGGTWTKQTSGIATALNGVTWANGKFVAWGASGGIIYSTNGTSWSTATGSGAAAFNRRAITWCPLLNLFVAVSTGQSYTSPTGAVWTAAGSLGVACTHLLFTPAGVGGQGTLWSLYASNALQYSTNSGTTWNQFTTFYPSMYGATSPGGPQNRSDTIIAKNSIEQFRLRGGMGGGLGTSGYGGSYRCVEPIGVSNQYTFGIGPGGTGAVYMNTTGSVWLPSTGTGGGPGAGSVGDSGGGGAYYYTDLVKGNYFNLFFPGGSGGYGSGNGNGGGGGSVFSYGGPASTSYYQRAIGRGSNGGSPSINYLPGGGGESCFRVPITVNQGDIVEAYLGLGVSLTATSAFGQYAGDGYAIVEYQM